MVEQLKSTGRENMMDSGTNLDPLFLPLEYAWALVGDSSWAKDQGFLLPEAKRSQVWRAAYWKLKM